MCGGGQAGQIGGAGDDLAAVGRSELDGEDGDALWSYLCRQWDRENDVEHNPGRKLLRFNFFMLQSDVLPEMAFSGTRKRLVHSFECVTQVGVDREISEKGDENPSGTDLHNEL